MHDGRKERRKKNPPSKRKEIQHEVNKFPVDGESRMPEGEVSSIPQGGIIAFPLGGACSPQEWLFWYQGISWHRNPPQH